MTRYLVFPELDIHVKLALRRLTGNEIVWVPIGPGAEHRLTEQGIQFTKWTKFLSPQEIRSIDEFSLHLMQTWNSGKIGFYKGFFVGELFIAFYNLFAEPIRRLAAAKNAIRREKPSAVICFGSAGSFREGLSMLCRTTHTRLYVVPTSRVLESLDLVLHYLRIGGLHDMKSALVSATAKVAAGEYAKPVMSSLFFNVFRSIHLRLRPVLGETVTNLVLPLLMRRVAPKYHTLRARNLRDIKNKHGLTVLFLCSFQNSVTTLQPVVLEALRRGHRAICIVTHPDGLAKCRELRLPYETLGLYWNGASRRRVNHAMKRLHAEIVRFVSSPAATRQFAYEGLSFSKDIEPVLVLLQAVAYEYALGQIETFERVFEVWKPHAIVGADDVGLAGRAFARMARLFGIPSINVQHSTIDDILRYKVVVSDFMALWGNKSLRQMVAEGVPPRILRLTGVPRFDFILSRKTGARQRVARDLGIGAGERIALWTPTPYAGITATDSPEINRETLLKILEALKGKGDLRLVVKLHPLDSKERYLSLLKTVGDKRTIVTRSTNVYDLLASCEFLMVCNSTTGIEAMLFEKPIIVVNLHNIPENVPYVESGAAIRARSVEELRDCIDSVLNDKGVMDRLEQGRRRFLADYAFKCDGKASQRIINLVEEAASGLVTESSLPSSETR